MTQKVKMGFAPSLFYEPMIICKSTSVTASFIGAQRSKYRQNLSRTLSSLEIFSLKVPVRISAYCSKSYLKKESFWQKVKLSCYVHHVLLQFLTRTLFHERILLWFHFFDSGRSKSGQQQKGLNYCKKNVMRFMIFFCY